MIRFFHYILFILSIMACNKAIKSEVAAEKETIVTVKDMHKLDGCTFLLITEEGKKLLPYKTEILPFALSDGLKMAITYKEAKNVDGICMAEDMIIDLKTIQLISTPMKPEKKACADIFDPVKTEWGIAAMNKDKAYRMWKYVYQDGFAYYIMGRSKNVLYDCLGNKMCEEGPTEKKCTSNIAELTQGKVVWTLDQ